MKDMQQRIEIFERLPVRQAVIRQILPAIASQMIALIYNLADTYYVGKLNDPSQTAAGAMTQIKPTCFYRSVFSLPRGAVDSAAPLAGKGIFRAPRRVTFARKGYLLRRGTFPLPERGCFALRREVLFNRLKSTPLRPRASLRSVGSVSARLRAGEKIAGDTPAPEMDRSWIKFEKFSRLIADPPGI